MSAKRPPALEEKAYAELDYELLKTTGEIKIIGDPFFCPTIRKSVPRGKFEITYTAELFDIMKTLGNKKIEVLSYILDHKDGNNCLNMTNTQLSKKLKVARQTVVDTMNILKDANLITRENSVIMINPRLMVKGNQVREAWLMRRYTELIDELPPKKALPNNLTPLNTIDAEIDEQLSFTDGGAIVQHAR